jgi:hypothetical protein
MVLFSVSNGTLHFCPLDQARSSLAVTARFLLSEWAAVTVTQRQDSRAKDGSCRRYRGKPAALARNGSASLLPASGGQGSLDAIIGGPRTSESETTLPTPFDTSHIR